MRYIIFVIKINEIDELIYSIIGNEALEMDVGKKH